MLSLLLLSCSSPSPEPPPGDGLPPCPGDAVVVGTPYTGTTEHPHIPLSSAGAGWLCHVHSTRPWLLAWPAASPLDCDKGPGAALPLPTAVPAAVVCLRIDGASEPVGEWTVAVKLLVSDEKRASVLVNDWP